MSDTTNPGGGTPEQPTTPLVPPTTPAPQAGQQQPAPGAAQQPAPAVPGAPEQTAPGYAAAPPAPPAGPQGYGAPQPPVQPKGLALAALIVGIASLVLCWLPIVGIIGGAVAVVLGIIALKKAQSKGMSLTGIITGAVAIVVSVIVLIVTIFIIGAAVNATNSAAEELGSSLEELESPTPETTAPETTEPTEDAPAEASGDRSPEFCAAFNAIAESSQEMTGTEVPPELLDAFRQLAEIDSPNQGVYERFYEFAQDPAGAASGDLSGLMEEYFDAAMEDGMACV